ncbi:MAG TPA: protein kinase [Aggregatilinea sp.]|uniref:serine/threonine-protein kinase n=1 Tax=Aggregatilinea sp. TaxID=2806333 RepID=UPI002C58ADEE|nr:protein kinase [Aggregatilinea sp.]HML20437.1 protein kinase [Aggregatilinea sp.]
MIGSRLGPYEIMDEIGHGGMATVYRAWQPSMDRFVAIKIIHRAIATEGTSLDRFEREAKLIARLEHPHILPIYDYNGMHDPPYIVMRYMPTGTLKDILQRDHLAFTEAAYLVRQIASALDYAHRQGVIHRDVKPSNIMVDGDGNAFLTDFGIARILESAEGLTASGLAVGTPGYMAPEQGMGLPIDNRADIYALGVMMFEMITGHTPYRAETPMAVILKHISDPVPLASAENPDISPDVDKVLLRAMAKDANDRYQTATEMADDLIAAIGPSAAQTPKHLQQIAAETIADLERQRIEAQAAQTIEKQIPTESATLPDGQILLPEEPVASTPATMRPRPVPSRRSDRRRWGVALLAVLLLIGVGGAYLLLRDSLQGGPDVKPSFIPTRSMCPQLVRQSLDNVRTQCADVGNNQICLGNSPVMMTLENGLTASLSQLGGPLPLSAIVSANAGSFSETTQSWGIAVIHAQTSLSEENSVAFLMLGDAQINPLDGRMRAFNFQTNAVTLEACPEAPPAALVVQVPQGEQAQFVANGVTITAGTTVILQATPAGQMAVIALDGTVSVQSQDVTRDVPAGYSTRVTMNADLEAVSPPIAPERIPNLQSVMNLVGPSPLTLLPDPLDNASLVTAIAMAPTLTDTPTPTRTPTNTKTPTSTYTPSLTPTDSQTPSSTPTDTPRPTSTDTPSQTPTRTPRPTRTPTETPMPTETATSPSPTDEPSVTPAPTNTVLPEPSATEMPSSTADALPLPTASAPEPTPVPVGQLPYIQDMEGEDALTGWNYDPMHWQLLSEGGNVVLMGLSGMNDYMEILGDEQPEWEEPTEQALAVTMRVSLRDNNSVGRIMFRATQDGYYVLELVPGYMMLKRGATGDVDRQSERLLRDWQQASIQAGRWYEVTIWIAGNRVFVYIDHQLRLAANDTGLALPPGGAIRLQTLSAEAGQVGFDDIVIQRPESASDHFEGSRFPTTWQATSITNVDLGAETDGNQYVYIFDEVDLLPITPPLGDVFVSCRLYSEVGGLQVRVREGTEGAYQFNMTAGNLEIQQLDAQGDIVHTWTRQNYYGRGAWFDFTVVTVGNRLTVYRQGETILDELVDNAPSSGGVRFTTHEGDRLRVDDCLFAETALSPTVDARFAFDLISDLEDRPIRDGLSDWYEFFDNAEVNAAWWVGGQEADPGEYIFDEAASERRRYYQLMSGDTPVFRLFNKDIDSAGRVFGLGNDRIDFLDSTDIYVSGYVRLPLVAAVGSTGGLGVRSVLTPDGASLNQYVVELVKDSSGTLRVQVRADTANKQAMLYEKPLDATFGNWHLLEVVTLDDKIAFFADQRLLAVVRDVEQLGGTLSLSIGPNSVVQFDDLVVRDTSINE